MRFGLASGALVLWLLVASATGLAGDTTEYFTAVVAGLACIGLPFAATASVGVVAWAFVTGFVSNRYGQLTVAHDDLVRLLTYVLATVAIALFTDRLSHVIRENLHE